MARLVLFAAVSLPFFLLGCDNAKNVSLQANASAKDDYFSYKSETVAAGCREGKVLSVSVSFAGNKVPASALAPNYRLLAKATRGATPLNIPAPFIITVCTPERATVEVSFSEGGRKFYLSVLPGQTAISFWPTFDHRFLRKLIPQGEYVTAQADLISVTGGIFLDRARATFLVKPFSDTSNYPLAAELMPSIVNYLHATGLPSFGERKLGNYARILNEFASKQRWRVSVSEKKYGATTRDLSSLMRASLVYEPEVIALLGAIAIHDGWNVWVMQNGPFNLIAIDSAREPGEWSAFIEPSGLGTPGGVLGAGRAAYGKLGGRAVWLSVRELCPYYEDNIGFEAEVPSAPQSASALIEVIDKPK